MEGRREFKYPTTLGLIVLSCLVIGCVIMAFVEPSPAGKVFYGLSGAFFLTWDGFVVTRRGFAVVLDNSKLTVTRWGKVTGSWSLDEVTEVVQVDEEHESGIRIYFRSGDWLALDCHLDGIEALVRSLREQCSIQPTASP